MAKPRKLDVDRAFAYLILRTSRLLRAHFHAMTSSMGIELSPEQWLILNRLTHQDGVPQTELVNATFRDRPNVSRMLASLERKRLIRRRADKNDARRYQVFITAKGRQLHDELIPVVEHERSQIYADLTESDFAALKRVLDIIDQRVAAKLAEGFSSKDGVST